MTSKAPSRGLERSLLRSGHRLVGGIDEVGRGALAGPVTVGVVVVELGTRAAPRGLRDSKLLTPAARESLQKPIRRWCVDWAVGHASAVEVDAIGIIAALRTAANRALGALHQRGTWPTAVILDGSHNWLRRPEREQGDLFEAWELDPAPVPEVHLKVKADLQCAAVAAASVLAKCERDGWMVALDAQHPGYGWALNKGYAVPEHLAALRALGASPLHRVSWRLPVGPDADDIGRSPDAADEALLAPGMMNP
jgi:ribonuclease HII